MGAPPGSVISASSPTEAASTSTLTVVSQTTLEITLEITSETTSETAVSTTLPPSSTSSQSPQENQASQSVSPPSTKLVLITSVLTQGAKSSNIVITSPVVAPALASNSPTNSASDNHLATILGPAIAIPIVLIVGAIVGCLIWRRKRQRPQRVSSFRYVNPDEIAYMYPDRKGSKAKRPGVMRKITGGLFHNRLSELPSSSDPTEPSELPGDTPNLSTYRRPTSELPGSEAGSQASPISPRKSSQIAPTKVG